MRKCVIILLYVLLLIGVFNNTFAETTKNNDNKSWEAVNDKASSISFLIPSGYKLKEDRKKTLNGEIVYSKTYIKYASNELFMVTASRYSKNTLNTLTNTKPETMLNYAKERLTNIYGGTISKEDLIHFNSCLGKELLIDSKKDNIYIRSINRIYWVPPFVYVIAYGKLSNNPFRGSIGDFLSENLEKFIFSLKINETCNSKNNKLYEDDHIPLLSPKDFIILSDYIQKQNIPSINIEDYILGILSIGYDFLTNEEKDEVDGIYAGARHNLSLEEQNILMSIKMRMDAKEKISMIEDSYSNKILIKMLITLPKDKLK